MIASAGRRARTARTRGSTGSPARRRTLQATAYFGEAPSSQAACDYREDCEAYHAGDADYASQIWYWTTPIAECVDGRTDVECIDYSQWTEAWSEIKG